MDYACPFCLRHEKTLQSLLARHAKDLRIIIRHHPLASHRHAPLAAAAALAANELGQGAAFHARLTSTSRPVVPSSLADPAAALETIAQDLGMDLTEFRAAMKRHGEQVRIDQTESRESFGVKGTPYTFINGIRIRGAVKESLFEEVIQKERAHAQKVAKRRGLSGKALYRMLVEPR